jgi:hypothetical protein
MMKETAPKRRVLVLGSVPAKSERDGDRARHGGDRGSSAGQFPRYVYRDCDNSLLDRFCVTQYMGISQQLPRLFNGDGLDERSGAPTT